jgi:hypothetical protein
MRRKLADGEGSVTFAADGRWRRWVPARHSEFVDADDE